MVHRLLIPWDADTWISNWKDYFRMPENILFSQSIRNILEYLYCEFQHLQPHIKNDYDFHLANSLAELTKKNYEEMRILNLCDKQVHEIFNNISIHLEAKKPDYPTISNEIVKLLDIYKSEKFLEAIQKEFVRNVTLTTMTSSRNIQVITDLLVRYLIDNFSPEYLNTLPESTFIRSLLQFHERSLRERLESDPRLYAELHIVAERALKLALRRKDIIRLSDDASLAELFLNNPRWIRNMEFYLMQLKVSLVENIGGIIELLNITSFNSTAMDDVVINSKLNNIVFEFTNAFLNTIAHMIIDLLIDVPFITLGRSSGIIENDYTYHFAEVMHQVAPRDQSFKNPYRPIVFESLQSAIYSWLSQIVTDNFRHNNPELERSIMKLFFDELVKILRKSREPNEFTVEQVRNGLFSFDLKNGFLYKLRQEARTIISDAMNNVPLPKNVDENS